MKINLDRFNRKTVHLALAVAVVAAVGWDLRHVYHAVQLLSKRASNSAETLQLLSQDLTLLSGCKRPEADQPTTGYETCLQGTLPSLKTGVGMFAGVAISTGWITHHPDDKTVRSAASATMDRLWQHYEDVDRASYRMADEAGEAFNESVVYRAIVGASYGHTDADWCTRLKELEFALNDPALARKQRDRDIAFAMLPAPALHTAPGQTTIK